MPLPRRVLFAALTMSSVLALSVPARAIDVPPFKGNDTGGIIAWTLAGQVNARQLAIDHCASYGKVARPLAAQRNYGGYLSFACLWPRPARSIYVAHVGYRVTPSDHRTAPPDRRQRYPAALKYEGL